MAEKCRDEDAARKILAGIFHAAEQAGFTLIDVQARNVDYLVRAVFFPDEAAPHAQDDLQVWFGPGIPEELKDKFTGEHGAGLIPGISGFDYEGHHYVITLNDPDDPTEATISRAVESSTYH